MVRSWMMSRSSSAKAAIMVTKNLPRAGQLAGQDPDADAARVEGIGDREHLLAGAAEPVQLPDDERVTGAQVVERCGEAGALRGGLPGADLLKLDPARASASCWSWAPWAPVLTQARPMRLWFTDTSAAVYPALTARS